MALLLWAESTAAAETGPSKGVGPSGFSAHGRRKTREDFPLSPPALHWQNLAGRRQLIGQGATGEEAWV
jgi:hypothetical protein